MNNWKEIHLSDCLIVRHGKNQHTIESAGGVYPILATGGEIGRTDTPIYGKPSVLIGRKGTIDKPRYMDSPFWTVDTLFYTEIKNNAIPKFIFYVFKTINWHWYNEASGVPSLSASTISKIKIRLPRLDEQRRIVTILETWDQAAEKLSKTIEQKKKMNDYLMRSLIAKERRLIGFKGDWKCTELHLIGTFAKGSGITKAELLADGIAAVRYGEIYTKHNIKIGQITSYISEASAKHATEIKHGDILFAGSGETIDDIGKSAVYLQDDRCYAGGDIVIFRPNGQNSLFLSYLLNSSVSRRKFRELGQGQSVVHIYKKDLSKLKLDLPPLPEQTAIAKILTAADDEITVLEQKLVIIKNQQKYLLNNLVTGKIRTPEYLKPPTKESTHA